MDLTSLLSTAKNYVFEILIKRMGPAMLASVVSALFALMAAHQGLLESWGITFGTWPLTWAAGQSPSGKVILIEMDTITQMGVAALFAVVSAISVLSAHHGADTIDKVAGNKPTNTPP